MGWSRCKDGLGNVAIAAAMVQAVGSEPCGSQIRSNRETAAPGTIAQPVPTRAQDTEILCSAEKPSVPKKSRSLRSRTSPRHRVTWATAWSVRLPAFEASMSP